MFSLNAKISTLLLMTTAVLSTPGFTACTLIPKTREVVREVCYERSDYRSKSFSYPCSERGNALMASGMCGLLGASAVSLVELNRKIGPATPRQLLAATAKETAGIAIILQERFGERAAVKYVEYVASIGSEIAQRNITDLISYPDGQFSGCLKVFKYNEAE